MTTLFLSHSSTDIQLVRAIRRRLEDVGHACWMAPDDVVSGGDPWTEQIVDAIRRCQVLLVILTHRSVTSDHVAREVGIAVQARRPVIPLRVEPVQLEGSLAYLLHFTQYIDTRPDALDEAMPLVLAAVRRAIAPVAADGSQADAGNPPDGTAPRPPAAAPDEAGSGAAGPAPAMNTATRRRARPVRRVAAAGLAVATVAGMSAVALWAQPWRQVVDAGIPMTQCTAPSGTRGGVTVEIDPGFVAAREGQASIAFMRQVDRSEGSASSLVLVDAAGAEVASQDLPGDAGFDVQPAWSADGRSVAFFGTDIEGSPLWIADLASGVAHPAAHCSWVGGTDLEWAPDGTAVLIRQMVPNGSFVVSSSDPPAIHAVGPTVAPDGEPAHAVARITWHPDGRLTFASQELDANGWPSAGMRVGTMDPDGSSPSFESEYIALSPSGVLRWSPDGGHLLLVADDVFGNRMLLLPRGQTDFTPLPEVQGELDPASPVWSPDGGRIAFATLPRADDRLLTADVFVVDVAAGSMTRLTDHAADDHSPTWSPDGRSLAFVSTRDYHEEVYAIDVDGTDERRLTTTPADVANLWPTWLPPPP